jgi:hypothetical protein
MGSWWSRWPHFPCHIESFGKEDGYITICVQGRDSGNKSNPARMSELEKDFERLNRAALGPIEILPNSGRSSCCFAISHEA